MYYCEWKKIISRINVALILSFILLLLCLPVYFVSNSYTNHFQLDYNKLDSDLLFAKELLKPFAQKKVSSFAFENYIDSITKTRGQLSSSFFETFENGSIIDRTTPPFIVTISEINVDKQKSRQLIELSHQKFKSKIDGVLKLQNILREEKWHDFDYEAYIIEIPDSYSLSNFLENFINIAFSILIPWAVVMLFINSYEKSKKEKQEINTAIEAAKTNAENNPSDVLPVWDIAQTTLVQYYNQNIIQIKWIFRLTLAVMIGGFCLICYGLFIVISNNSSTLVAIIASASGIITEFIGLTFLFVYKSTIAQAFKHTSSLEKMNTVGMSIKILDTLKESNDDAKKLSDAKIEIAKLLIIQSGISKEIK